MPTRNGEYSVVGLSDNWTATSVKDTKLAMAIDTGVRWGKIALHLPEEDKVTNLADPPIALPLTKAPVTLLSKAWEPYHWSPTQQEVDAYVNSQESEISQEGLHLRQRRVAQRGALALVPMRRSSNYSRLFWCAVAAVASASWLSLVFD